MLQNTHMGYYELPKNTGFEDALLAITEPCYADYDAFVARGAFDLDLTRSGRAYQYDPADYAVTDQTQEALSDYLAHLGVAGTQLPGNLFGDVRGRNVGVGPTAISDALLMAFVTLGGEQRIYYNGYEGVPQVDPATHTRDPEAVDLLRAQADWLCEITTQHPLNTEVYFENVIDVQMGDMAVLRGVPDSMIYRQHVLAMSHVVNLAAQIHPW